MLVAPIDLVPFLCKATGRCCIHNLVILSSFDIFRIGKTLGASAKELFTKKLITYRINPASFWMEPILNSRTNSTCPFLFREVDANTEQYLCEIYESRPLVCRIYPLKYDKDNSVFMRFLPAEPATQKANATDNEKSLIDTIKEKAETDEGKKVIETIKEKAQDKETQDKLKGLFKKDEKK